MRPLRASAFGVPCLFERGGKVQPGDQMTGRQNALPRTVRKGVPTKGKMLEPWTPVGENVRARPALQPIVDDEEGLEPRRQDIETLWGRRKEVGVEGEDGEASVMGSDR